MKQGEKYKDFKVRKVTHIEEIKVDLIEIVHLPSGAEIVHVACDDDENVFSLCFNTNPSDHTGVAHVLEHLVLCGSEKFKVADPFFSMQSRSAHSFMNALTASLWTAYPAASRIEKDLFNLLDVYLDAVFHPLLRKESFLQEAHRLTFEVEDDPSTDLIHSGVVYNEMIGVLSNAMNQLWRKTMEFLYPEGHPYSYNSGGEPADILKLTREELIAFHKTHYDPALCHYFFYGNIPTTKYLDFIDERVLSEAKPKPRIPDIENVKRRKEKRYETLSYSCNDEDLTKKTFVSFSWLTTEITNQDELLALSILDFLLMDNDASLLKKALLESGFCQSADSGYDTDTKDVPYLIFCSGSDAKNADKLEKCLFETLEKICAEGISEKLIESALHQIEFGRLEIGGGSSPYGIELFYRTILSKMQGGSLDAGLKVHSLFKSIREKLEDKSYLPNLIKTYFLDNPHFVRIVMSPDREMQSIEQEKEKKRLSTLKKSLTQEETQTILDNAKLLKEYHEKKKTLDVSCLPMLNITDAPKDVTYYPLEKYIDGRAKIYHHDCFTNKIIYADLIFDIPQIDREDLSYFRLFSTMLTGLGAGGKDYVETLQYTSEYLGGIGTQISLNVQMESVDTCYPTFSISAKCLLRNAKQMFKLMHDYMLQIDYNDRKRIKELTTQIYTHLSSNINSNAIRYAIKQSTQYFSPWSFINNTWYGLPYYKFIEDLTQNLDEKLPTLMEKFASFAKTIFHLNNVQLVLACDQEDFDSLQKENFYDLLHFSKSSQSFVPWIDSPNPGPPEDMGRILSADIAHNALSISTITIRNSASAAVRLACFLAENLVIHPRIREEGGAYSTGISYNILTGSLSIYSSRDPRVFHSHMAFIDSLEEIAEGNFSEQDLKESKLNYLQSVDMPASPGHRATITYFQLKVGLKPDIRQWFRDHVFAVTKEEIQTSLKEHVLPKLREEAVRVSYAGKGLLEEANLRFAKAGEPILSIKSL